MPYLKKVKIKGNDYFYLFHTVRDSGKYKKLSKYIGKEEPSKEELERLKKGFIEKIKGRLFVGEVKEEKPRANILGRLKEMQREYGCLPEDKVRELSKDIGLSVVEIYGMASFYSMFSFDMSETQSVSEHPEKSKISDEKGKKVVRICNSLSCYLNDSLNVLREAKRLLGIDVGESTKDGRFSLELTSCIGCCDKAPAIMINDELIVGVTKERLRKLLK